MSFFKNGYQIFKDFVSPESLNCFVDSLYTKPVFCYGNQNFFKLIDPYIHCEEIIDLILSQKVKQVCSSFMGDNWGIGGCNLRRNILTKNVDSTITKFHRDNNSKNFIKLFFYLNDVDIGGGPFTYVEGSHIDRLEDGWTPGSRWSDEHITSLYGANRIKYLVANKGDLIVANTTGFHKGLKCVDKERMMLTINITTEEEKFGRFKMSREKFDKLTEDDRFRCRFMEII